MQHTGLQKHPDSTKPSLWSRGNIALIAFLAIAGFYLVTEHRAHLFGILPFLLLLACPLIHMFMHRGHGGHGGSRDAASATSTTPTDTQTGKQPVAPDSSNHQH